MVEASRRSDGQQVKTAGQVSTVGFRKDFALIAVSRNKAILVAAKDSEYGLSNVRIEDSVLML
jgi:hypothetical protein